MILDGVADSSVLVDFIVQHSEMCKAQKSKITGNEYVKKIIYFK